MATIVYKKKMKELMGVLGYGSIQTVKDAKYRCKKTLIKKMNEIKKQAKNG